MAKGFTQKEADEYRERMEYIHHLHDQLLTNPAYASLLDKLQSMIEDLDGDWYRLATAGDFQRYQGKREALQEFMEFWVSQCPKLIIHSERETSVDPEGVALTPSLETGVAADRPLGPRGSAI